MQLISDREMKRLELFKGCKRSWYFSPFGLHYQHTAALSTDNLAKEYFGIKQCLVMLGCTKKEIRQGIACVKQKRRSDMGDDHKEYCW